MAETQQAPVTPTPQVQKSGSNTALKVILIVLGSCVVLVVIGFVAFGFIAKKAIEKGGPQIAEKLVERAVEQGSDGEVDLNLSTSSIPEGFPSKVPVFPGAKPTYAATTTGEGGSKNYTVTFSTTKSVKEVSDYYTQALKTNGWTTSGTYQAAEGFSINGENAGLMVYVIVGADEGQNETSILLTTAETQ